MTMLIVSVSFRGAWMCGCVDATGKTKKGKLTLDARHDGALLNGRWLLETISVDAA